MARRIRKFDHDIAADRYRAGESVGNLATLYQVDKKTLRKALKRAGVELRPACKPPSTYWVPERIAQARALAADGKSASQIAAAFGIASRHAVISAHHRYDLGLINPPGFAVFNATKRADHGGGLILKMRARARAERFGKAVAPVEIPSSVEIIGCLAGQGIPGPRECRWIEGDPASGGRYCAQPTHDLTSWCPHHYNRCFNFQASATRPRAKLANARLWS